MKRVVFLSLACSLALYSDEVVLDDIDISTQVEVVKDINKDDIKSADLGEVLFKNSPSISIIRRSATANDITIRGQKKDNINVTIDGAKIYGACPNRMDPPISHILTNNVDYIEINEGPFSVSDFGVLSSDVKVHTITPKKEFKGVLDASVGSFGYRKSALNLSGGGDNVKILISSSIESSKQYLDGNGDDFYGQIAKNILSNNLPTKVQYQNQYKDSDSYSKKTFMGKLFWDITQNQKLKLSYTANRSDNILYPSSVMDALYDNSDIYTLEYSIKNLASYSKKLDINIYQSSVEHPMSTKYRLLGETNYMTHSLTTKTQGAKITNSFDISNHKITVGLDSSKRNWNGEYQKNGISSGFYSLDNVTTDNRAIFFKDIISLDKLSIDWGFRYDSSTITNDSQPNNSYDSLSGYVLAKYKNSDSNYFVGIGSSNRVPDAKELYFVSSQKVNIGNPSLKMVTNYELDIGGEKQFESSSIKYKLFYSKLNNYIAYNDSTKKYENVDASVYGFEFSGLYMSSENLYFDYSLAYQRGTKDNPLTNQTGTNLADISPFKFHTSLNYEFDNGIAFKTEFIYASSWSDIDEENGEQTLPSYSIINLKLSKTIYSNIDLTIGIDNILDETYAISNTYKDLTLLDTATNDVMLLNERGRYLYMNVKYRF